MTTTLDAPRIETRPAAETTGARETGGFVIVAWSGDLDKVWPTLILATTAAASGRPTTIFFTFWGLFPLVRNDRGITGKNWMQKMLSVMNRGGTDHLKLSKMHFAGMGKAMMMSLAKRNNVATPQELLELAQDAGVRLIPCQMTMDMMGLTRADLIPAAEEPVGAASAIALMEGATTLFT